MVKHDLHSSNKAKPKLNYIQIIVQSCNKLSDFHSFTILHFLHKLQSVQFTTLLGSSSFGSDGKLKQQFFNVCSLYSADHT